MLFQYVPVNSMLQFVGRVNPQNERLVLFTWFYFYGSTLGDKLTLRERSNLRFARGQIDATREVIVTLRGASLFADQRQRAHPSADLRERSGKLPAS